MDAQRILVSGRSEGTMSMSLTEVRYAAGKGGRGQSIPAFRVLLLGLLSFTVDPTAAQDIRLEAEIFIDSQDNGYDPIAIVPCNLASGGFAVDGVDATSDRIVLDLPLDAPLCFQSGIRSAGDLTLVRVFEVSIASAPGDSALFADTLTTIPGSGVG
jgi:hypothetical protein